MDNSEIIKFSNKKSTAYSEIPPKELLKRKEGKIRKLTPLHQLSIELHQLYKDIDLEKNEHKIRHYVIKKLNEKLIDCKLNVTGSIACNIYFSNSPITLTLTVEEDEDFTKKKKIIILESLMNRIVNINFINKDTILVLDKLQEPILVFYDHIGFLYKIYINEKSNYNSDNRFLKNNDKRIFTHLIYYFLDERGLTDGNRGGLDFDHLLILVRHFFKFHPLLQLKLGLRENFAMVILDFFQYFAELNFTSDVHIDGFKKSEGKGFYINGDCISNFYAIRELFMNMYKPMVYLIGHNRYLCEYELLSLWTGPISDKKYDYNVKFNNTSFE